MKIKIKALAFLTILIFAVTSVYIPITSFAAGGSGTANNPYILTTADDINNIRKNLSAHYKLGNSIDLSGIANFTPIGTLARPFTGSFTCDLDESGKPKYCIYNLSMKNNAGEKNGHNEQAPHSDYSKNNSKWETGFFGATNGATVSNIVILNANIVSTVAGVHDLNSLWVANPGMNDEMGTAILIGIANNTSVSGCTVSGKVVSSSNETGALVGGVLKGSTIKNCYGKVEVEMSGAKHNGTFIGYVTDNSTVENCGVDGVITQKMVYESTYPSEGFIGCTGDSVIKNCYSRGTAMGGSSFNRISLNGKPTFENCYTTVETGTKYEKVDNGTITNCFQVTDSASRMPKKTLDEAKAGLSGKGDWDVSGQYPEIKTLNRNVDVNAYSKEAMVSTPSDNASSGDTQNGGSTGTTTVGGAVQQSNVQKFTELLNSLPETISIENKEDVKTVRRMYDNMTDAEFAEITDDMTAKLNSVTDQLNLLLLTYIIEGIEALPEVDKLTSEHAEKVKELYDDYQFLSDDMKSNFSEDGIKKLEEAYEKLGGEEGETLVIGGTVSTTEKIVIIVLIVLNVLCIAGMITLFTLSLLSYKRMKAKAADEDLSEDEEA